MNFEKLRNSIEVNSGEAPSVYMAMCLIETIFRDIKDEAGTDISMVDTGDETWPLKTALVYRYLNKICTANKEGITRGQKQLEELRAEAVKIEEELETVKITDDYINAQKELNEEKKRQLDQAKAMKEEYDSLSQEYKKTIEKIDTYKNVDPVLLREELEKKKNELNAIAPEIERDSKEVSELDEELNYKKESLQKLIELKQQRSDETKSIDKEIAELKDQIYLLKENSGIDHRLHEKKLLEDEWNALNKQIEDADLAIEKYGYTLTELKRQVNEKQASKDEYERSLGEYRAAYDRLAIYDLEDLKKKTDSYKNRAEALREAGEGLVRMMDAISIITGESGNDIKDAHSINSSIDQIEIIIDGIRERFNEIRENKPEVS